MQLFTTLPWCMVNPAYRCGTDHHFTGPPDCQQPEGHGSVSHAEGQLLATVAATIGGPALEIGANLGISSRYILDGLMWRALLSRKPTNHRLISVDIRHLWTENAMYRIRVDADSATYTPPMKCRWAFIDGDHQYKAILADIGTALRAGCKTLVFHDTKAGYPSATAPAVGSDARRAVLTAFPQDLVHIYDIDTECGLMVAEIK